jgi:C-terminal processing protease CtpA/Prc
MVPPSLRGFGVRVEETDGGLRITQVEPAGPAQQLHLEAGDCIETLNGMPVRSALGRELWRRLLAGELEYVRLRIRDGRTGHAVTRHVSLPGKNGQAPRGDDSF